MLDELRQKSPAKKDAYAFWTALLATLVVAAGWAATLPFRFGTLSSVAETTTEQSASLSELLNDVKEGAGDAFNSLATTTPAASGEDWDIFVDSATTTRNDPILIATTTNIVPIRTVKTGTSSESNQ